MELNYYFACRMSPKIILKTPSSIYLSELRIVIKSGQSNHSYSQSKFSIFISIGNNRDWIESAINVPIKIIINGLSIAI